MDVLKAHPIRKNKKQKRDFREDVVSFLEGNGYTCTLNNPKKHSQNVIAGDPASAKILITAHYDTPAVLPIPNLITPCNFALYMLYQLLVIAMMFAPSIIAYFALSHFATPGVAEAISDLLIWVVLILACCGPANKHNANDNTSGVVTLLTIAKNLPEEYRSQVCFVLFDNEEAGLLGSSSYATEHWENVYKQTVLNLDCVGEGQDIVFFPNGKMLKDAKRTAWLRTSAGSRNDRQFYVKEKGFAFYPSDQKNMPYGVGIAALKRTRKGTLYLDKIHTNKDTVLDETNVTSISDCLIHMVKNSEDLPCEPHNGKIPKKKSILEIILILVVLFFVFFLIGFMAGAAIPT